MAFCTTCLVIVTPIPTPPRQRTRYGWRPATACSCVGVRTDVMQALLTDPLSVGASGRTKLRLTQHHCNARLTISIGLPSSPTLYQMADATAPIIDLACLRRVRDTCHAHETAGAGVVVIIFHK